MATAMRALRTRWGQARKSADVLVPLALSPLIGFPALWLLGIALGQIHVLNIQGDWSGRAWVVMLVVPAVFAVAVVLGGRLVSTIRRDRPAAGGLELPRPHRRLRIALAAIAAVGCAEAAHQFITGGSVPLLAESIDQSRVSLPQGPTYIFVNGLTIAAIGALSVPPRLFARAALPELAIAAVALATLALLGGRSTLLLPIAVAFFVRWILHGRVRTTWVLVGAILAAGAVSAVFFLRTAQPPTDNLDREIYAEVVPDTPAPLVPLVPLHFAIAMNFEALAHVVDHFPAEEPYGGGKYNAVTLDRFVGGTERLTGVTNELTPGWLVSTAAGPLFADGGLPAVVVGMLLIGLIAGACHRLVVLTGRLAFVFLYGYVAFWTLFMAYDNYWTQYIDWLVVAPALFLLGRYAIGTDPEPARLSSRPSMPASSHESSAPRISFPQRLRSRSTARAVGVLALVAALAVIVIAISDSGVDRITREPASSSASAGDPAILTGPALAPDDARQFVTDGELPSDNVPLYEVEPLDDEVRVTRYWTDRGKRLTGQSEVLALPAGRRVTYDVGRWDTSAMFAMVDRGSVISVAQAPLDGASPSALGGAVVEKIEPGTARDLRIALWSGARPDLFVIERGAPRSRPTLRVFSGESGFRKQLVAVRLPVVGLLPRTWELNVGRTSGDRPDLVMVKRAAATRPPEVHVLTGASEYQEFLLQRPLPAPGVDDLATLQYRYGDRAGVPAVYEIESGEDEFRVRILPLPIQPSAEAP